MNTEDVAYLPVTEQVSLIKSRQLSPVELVRTYLDRIDRWDKSLRAYITVCREESLEAARTAEADVLRGAATGPLHGIPIGLKDQIWTKGIATTAGSRILRDFIPGEDAAVTARLKGAGAIILGKHNLTEFALGGTLEFPYGEPRNPWDQEYSPSGSSSGSGIAPAAGLCSAAIGEDTGGSIRGPASNNGIVGLRPSWGRVSRYGLVPLSWTLDTAGPMTRTVEDCSLLLQVISGHDPRDSATARLPVPNYRASLTGEITGVRVGIIQELMDNDFIDAEVQAAAKSAATLLEALGARVEWVSLPLLKIAGPVFLAICDSEAAALHQDNLVSRPLDYDQGTRRRLITAGLVPLSLYHKAQQARNLLRDQILGACQRFDVLLSPMSASPPQRITDTKKVVNNRELGFRGRMYATPFVLSGTPAMSVPGGFTRSGLPIGIQLVASRFNEAAIFRVAYAYERNSDWHARRPVLP